MLKPLWGKGFSYRSRFIEHPFVIWWYQIGVRTFVRILWVEGESLCFSLTHPKIRVVNVVNVVNPLTCANGDHPMWLIRLLTVVNRGKFLTCANVPARASGRPLRAGGGGPLVAPVGVFSLVRN